jgi:septal ring factor EnvC (AmiA/AmiB activator)
MGIQVVLENHGRCGRIQLGLPDPPVLLAYRQPALGFVARQPLILKDHRQTDSPSEQMRKPFDLRRHLVGSPVKPARQPHDHHRQTVVPPGEATEHLGELADRGSAQPGHPQGLEGTREHHRRIADRDPDSPLADVKSRDAHVALYYPPSDMVQARVRMLVWAITGLCVLAYTPPLRGQEGSPFTGTVSPGPAPTPADRAAVLEAEAERLARESRTILGDLRKLEVERALQEERRRGAIAAVERATRMRDEAKARLRALEATRSTQVPDVRARLVDLYKRGRGGNLRLVLGATSLKEFAWSTRAVASMAEVGKARLDDYARLLADARKEEAAAAAALQRVQAERQAVDAAQSAASRAVRARAALLSDIDARRDLTAQLAGELQVAARRLDERVTTVASMPAPASPLAPVFPPRLPVRGGLAWPLDGPLTGRFGDASPRAPGTPRNGIEIEASEGAPARAIHAGSVVFAAPLSGFGTLVIVDHSRNYHSVYGYLASTGLKTGDSIEVGQEVGRVGASPGGPPSLYFEFRIDGRSVDPLQWLQQR